MTKQTTGDDRAVEFIDVGMRYPNGYQALRGINLIVRRGQCLALLGTSGSGKSTLLRMMNRLVEPTDGEVLVRGRPVDEWDPIALRRSIGYVIQEAGLLPHLTVLQNAALVPRLLGTSRETAHKRASELLKLVGLEPERHAPRLPRELSGGERQRVGLARALAADPDLMLMDEPFGALDPLTRRELQNEFDSLRRRLGKTVVLVTHDVREACRLADQIIVLHAGKIVAADTPAALLRSRVDPFVAEFFRDADAITMSDVGARS